MNAEVLYDHLRELGVVVVTNEDCTSLLLDAPENVLTSDLLGVLTEYKAALVQLVFEEEERAAIQWEGSRLNTTPRLRPPDADKNLACYLGGSMIDTRDVLNGVPQWTPPHAANF